MSGSHILLLGVIGDFGVVTGGGSKACGSVFTGSKFEGRIVGGGTVCAPDLGDCKRWTIEKEFLLATETFLKGEGCSGKLRTAGMLRRLKLL